MAFRNPIIGSGDTLVRAAIQSEGYQAGVSGWRISRDGDAEFNDIIARGIGQVRYIPVTVDENVNNSTAVQDDNELTATVEAGAIYDCEFWVSFFTNVACDVRTRWNVPAVSGGFRAGLGATSVAAGYTSRQQHSNQSALWLFQDEVVYQLGTGNLAQLIWERALISVPTAGSITFQWAQGTAVVGNLTRAFGSFMRITRMQ